MTASTRRSRSKISRRNVLAWTFGQSASGSIPPTSPRECDTTPACLTVAESVICGQCSGTGVRTTPTPHEGNEVRSKANDGLVARAHASRAESGLRPQLVICPRVRGRNDEHELICRLVATRGELLKHDSGRPSQISVVGRAAWPP
eukprot:UN5091